MKKFLRLEVIFIKQYLKQLIEYKSDFFVGIIGMFLTQGLEILFISIIFNQIPSLNGWTFKQVAFIYGFSLIPKGIDHLFFDNLWAVGQRLVWKGEFDKYMTRPLNPLFHVLVEHFQVDAFGELIIGISLLTLNISVVQWDWLKVCIFIISIPFTTLIYTSLKIIAASMAFWSKRAGSVMYVFYMINDFSKYPLSIYNKGIRALITFVLPFAFTAFYPADYLITGQNFAFHIGGLFVISILLFCLALKIWDKGISVYESAGS